MSSFFNWFSGLFKKPEADPEPTARKWPPEGFPFSEESSTNKDYTIYDDKGKPIGTRGPVAAHGGDPGTITGSATSTTPIEKELARRGNITPKVQDKPIADDLIEQRQVEGLSAGGVLIDVTDQVALQEAESDPGYPYSTQIELREAIQRITKPDVPSLSARKGLITKRLKRIWEETDPRLKGSKLPSTKRDDENWKKKKKNPHFIVTWHLSDGSTETHVVK